MQKINNLFDSKQVIIIFIFFLVGYVFLYPPFLYIFYVEEDHKIIRLAFEGAALSILGFSLLKDGLKTLLWVGISLFLYLINYSINYDDLGKSLSHFNKIAFVFFIAHAMKNNQRLKDAVARFWYYFWLYCPVVGIIGLFLILSRLATPVFLDDYAVNYDYFHFPIIGNFLLRATKFGALPRFTSYMVEPIVLSYFFGFNMLIAKYLIDSRKKQRIFFILNLVGGIITFSTTFFLFLFVYGALKGVSYYKKIKNKFIYYGVGASLLVAFLLFTLLFFKKILPSSSIGERLPQLIDSFHFFKNSSWSNLFFGAGIVFFQNMIRGGASAGVVDIMASRGILLLLLWIWGVYKCSKNIPGLFAYLMFYSLTINYWHFPFVILGLGVSASIFMTPVKEKIL